MKRFAALFAFLAMCVPVMAQSGRFADVVGPIAVEPVKQTEQIQLHWLTWGGDVAFFLANGGVETTKDSTFGKFGLNIKLSKGDDFAQSTRDYMTGKTPFLRGTLDMLGQASEVIGSDPRTKPVVFLQLTWSAGDHIVARENIKSLNDLVRADRKVKIACQQGGPHVGLLFKALLAAQAKMDKIEIVWTQDLSGPKGPAELFRNDNTIDAACVISPDMTGLCGGLDSKGSGSEGTVKGAHVVASTAQMSRATADVIACRSDYFEANRDKVEKIIAGYLNACEHLVGLRKQFNETKKLSPEYKNILTIAQTQFGKDVIPTLEVDGHGLLLDAVFVGLPGQISFFQDKGNLNGFEPSSKLALDLATTWGYAKVRSGFTHATLDYQKIAKLGGIVYSAPERNPMRIVAESANLTPDSDLDDRTLLSFNINFKAEESTFNADLYGPDFNRVIENAGLFGNAVIVIRGHSDPTKTLVDFLKAGLAKGLIKRTGEPGKYVYYLKGKVLDLNSTDQIIQLLKSGDFDGTNPSPRETFMAALNLSQSRAEQVKNQIIKIAGERKVNFDLSQVQPIGIGIQEPLIAKPKNIEEAEKNMRVEFRIVKVPAEAIKSTDFDY
jgi:hypothetical protein